MPSGENPGLGRSCLFVCFPVMTPASYVDSRTEELFDLCTNDDVISLREIYLSLHWQPCKKSTFLGCKRHQEQCSPSSHFFQTTRILAIQREAKTRAPISLSSTSTTIQQASVTLFKSLMAFKPSILPLTRRLSRVRAAQPTARMLAIKQHNNHSYPPALTTLLWNSHRPCVLDPGYCPEMPQVRRSLDMNY